MNGPAPVRMAWILGWALPETWFASLVRDAFPQAQHTYIASSPRTWHEVAAAGQLDWMTGYSLGAHLLLREGLGHPASTRVALLAPIFAFAREEDAGGRIAGAQVQYLARWLRRDRPAALADFYQRAGLELRPEQIADVTLEDLAWGLSQLAHERARPRVPPNWRAWCGADDPLLDAAKLHALAPGVDVVPGATHHPRALLRAMAKAIA